MLGTISHKILHLHEFPSHSDIITTKLIQPNKTFYSNIILEYIPNLNNKILSKQLDVAGKSLYKRGQLGANFVLLCKHKPCNTFCSEF